MSDQAEPIGAGGVALRAAEAIRRAFFTSVSGEKPHRYHLSLAYRSMDEMHGAEDAIKAWAKSVLEPAATAPDPKAAGVEREALAKRLCVHGMTGPKHGLSKFIGDLLCEAAAALRAVDAAPGGGVPIPMILHCPRCHVQHVDEPDERTPEWDNPPHRSHLCHSCGCIWRPADVATEGVRDVTTIGKADNWTPATPTAAPAPNVQALVEACKPFAHAAEPIIDNGEDWQPDEWMNRLVKINVGQYRALAQALAAIQAPAGEADRDDVQCHCVGQHGPNPECGACSGSGCITTGATPPAGDRGRG